MSLILSVFILDPVLFPNWLGCCCFKVWLAWLVCKPPFQFHLPSIFDLIYFVSSADAVKPYKRNSPPQITFTSSASVIRGILDGICCHAAVKRLIKKKRLGSALHLLFFPPRSLFTPHQIPRLPLSLICLSRRQSGGNADTSVRDLRTCHTSRLSGDDDSLFSGEEAAGRRSSWGAPGLNQSWEALPAFFN